MVAGLIVGSGRTRKVDAQMINLADETSLSLLRQDHTGIYHRLVFDSSTLNEPEEIDLQA